MSDTAHPPDIPPASDTPAATIADEQPASPTSMDKPVVSPVNHATRDPKFGPGVGQAFFSTELGARAPRSLGPIRMPVIARSVQDPSAVVQAATHWQTKYKNQCLCILPSQGWTVDDLWDAEDLHIEGRKFCEEMLIFISRSTYYAADRFAKDWARAHPDRVNFTGLQMGNVYDINDPLAIIDQIFVFGEPLGFPRVFLWHVAHILVTTWIEMNKATNATLRESLTPQARTWGQQTTNEVAEPSSIPVGTTKDKNRKPSSAVDQPDRVALVATAAPDQPITRPVSQRIPSQGLVQPGGHSGLLRGGDASIPVGPSRSSPSMHPLPLNVPKSNRNMGSGSYNQHHGWVENNNRTIYGAYPRQPSGPMPSIQSPQFVSPQMAMAQHVPQPIMTGAGPYVQVAHPGYAFQPSDTGMMARAHVNYQQGMMQAQPMSPASLQQPHGQHFSMGDMTNNMHHANAMMLQHQDSRAPVPHPSNPRGAQDLYDPYSGNNHKFNGGPGHHNGGRKGSNNSFASQAGRGRKVSNPGGREPYNRSNSEYNATISSGSTRHTSFNNRRRPSEDDPAITGDSVSGCGHTWIGPKNSTVDELWVGDLIQDTSEGELVQMFKQAVGITPTSIALRGKFGSNSLHAFATFASCSDAKAALGITKFRPQVRGARPVVTVPRRFYQKDTTSTTSYFDQSHTGQTTDSTDHDASLMSNQQEKPVTDADLESAAASDKALYSPQDARSGLSKKPSPQSDVADRPASGDVKLEMPKRQQKSPTKKNKGKGRRESPIQKTDPADETTKTSEKLKADDSTIMKEEDNAAESINTVPVPTKPASVDAATLPEEHVVSPPKSSLSLDQPADAADAVAVQSSKGSDTLETGHGDEASRKETNTKVSLDYAGIVAKGLETASDTTSVTKGVKNTGGRPFSTTSKESSVQVADDNISDDDAKNDTSFHSAPEIQPESVQAELRPEFEDNATTTNQDPSQSPSIPTETGIDNSPTLATQPSTTQSDPPTPAPPIEDNPAQVATSDSAQSLTTGTTDLQGIAMSTFANVTSAVTATKKAGAQQVQSLHPFAKSNKSQAKREKEAKKKQQKKEDADRNAKAKADKAASSKKLNDGLSPQPKTGLLEDSANLSIGADADVNPEPAHPMYGDDTATGKKKSKGKAKAQTVDSSSVDRTDKAVTEGENGKLNGAIINPKEIPSVAHKTEKMEAYHAEPAKQESSERSGKASAYEPAPSPTPFVPSIIPKAQAVQEVNDPHKSASNHPTHVPGDEVSQIDSHPDAMFSSSMANDSVSSQHDTPPQERHSRSSSSSTLVGDEDEVRPFVFPTPASILLDPSQAASTPPEAPQLATTPTAAPKKKKKKPKKKKKSITPASESAVAPPDDTNATDDEVDFHTYDPFESQLSHIDAIRRAVKHDTTSYFARTNARMEKEAEERREAGQPSKTP